MMMVVIMMAIMMMVIDAVRSVMSITLMLVIQCVPVTGFMSCIDYLCARENNPFSRLIARRATFHQSGYSGTEATSLTARSFVHLQPRNRVRCIRCAGPPGDHWIPDPVMGPNLKIRRKPSSRFRARRATIHQRGYSGTEATSFAARGFVLLQPGNRVRCIRCARPPGDHWIPDPVMGPYLKIHRYCLEENVEENNELYIG